MINGKLEEPFTKYANGLNDLKWLSPIDVKAELSKKFYEEIDFEKIENYGIQHQKKFLNNHPDIANKIKTQNLSDSKNNIADYNANPNNNYNTNYSYNEIKDKNINNINYNNDRPYYTENNNYYMGDNRPMGMSMPMKQKQINIRNNNVNNMAGDFSVVHNKMNNNKNYNDKVKLINIIRDLEQKVIERDEIIEFQNKQIEQIKNRINFIQNLQSNSANNEQ